MPNTRTDVRPRKTVQSDGIEAFIRPIAHRGLHDAQAGIIENTASAFAAAIDGDYAIECDIRPARDGVPVVFHDETLSRLTGLPELVAAATAAELAKVPYLATANATETIITLAELLRLVDGRVPLMVEIKNEWEVPDPDFLAQIAALANDYRGAIALKSFDPALMRAIRPLAPDIPRGIVAGKYKAGPKGDWWSDQLGPLRRFQLSHLLDCRGVAPSFISYNVKDLPALAPMIARRIFKLPLFTWTVRSAADRAIAATYADAPIFEGFRP